MSRDGDVNTATLLDDIKKVIPILNNLGKKKGASDIRYMITLYAASHILTFRRKAALESEDLVYFNIYNLSQIAADREGLFGQQILFDKARTAEKIYKELEKEGFVKFLPRKDLLKLRVRDTSYVALTKDGSKYCERILEERLSVERRKNIEFGKNQGGSILRSDATTNPFDEVGEFVYLKPRVFKGERTIFVGRERQIQELRRIIGKTNDPISLVGEGGIGKSALAFKLLNYCQDVFDYESIPIYIESGITFESFISEIAKKIRIFSDEFYKEDVERRGEIVLNALARVKHPLIFADNYETISEGSDKDVSADDRRKINSFLESVPSNTSIILTSRYKKNLIGEYIYYVHGLTEEESVRLFVQISKRHFMKRPPEIIINEIKKISDEIGGHPLSIKLLAGSYQGGGISELESMVKHVLMDTANEMEEQKRLRSIRNCFDYSFDKLSDKNKKLLLELCLFKSPFLNSAVRQIFSLDEERLFDLFNRSFILNRELEEDPYFETPHRLYDFHPVIKKYLEQKPYDKRLFLQSELLEGYTRYYYRLSDYIYHLLDSHVHSPTDFSLLKAFNLIIKRRENDFEQAIELTTDPKAKSFIANRLSMIMRSEGLPMASLYYAKKSLEIDSHDGDLERIANDYTNLANVFIDVKDNDRALEYHQKALDIHIQLNSSEAIARQYNNIGNIFLIDNPDKALEYFENSCQINKGIGNELGLAYDYTGIGNAYYKKGNLEGALANHEMALKFDEKANNVLQIATDYSNLGFINSKLGYLSEALRYHNKALELDREIDNKKGMIRDYKKIAKIYETNGDINNSRKYEKKAQNLENEVDSIDTNYRYPVTT